MKRRAFVVGLAAVAALPVLARAQQKTPLIGFLSGRSEESDKLYEDLRP